MHRVFTAVNVPKRQKDGRPRVTGEARFYADVRLPRMLTVRTLRSPHPRARILSIDTGRAEKYPGVALVMTFMNFPQIFRPDVHYVGEHVASVVAEDAAAAEEALDLIAVTYEPLPFVLSLEEAMAESAPRVFADQPNVHDWAHHYYLSDRDPETRLFRQKTPHHFTGFGDVEQGFAEADIIVEQKGFKYAYCKSPAMEPRGCTADWSGGRLHLYTHSQSLHEEKTYLGQALGIPASAVNYISPFTGSSFGGKNPDVLDPNIASHYQLIAARASMTLGRPVHCAYSREEEMLCAWSRGSLANVKLGFLEDGTLTTIRYEHWQEVGTDGDHHPPRNSLLATGCVLYSRNCRHMYGKVRYVFTNRFLSVGWQGYGAPEGHFAMESTMDMAAERLGLGPIELRKRNHMRAGDIDAGWDPLSYKSAYISSSGLSECLDAGAARLDWAENWKRPEEKTGRFRSGLGVAIFAMGAGRPGQGNSSEAIVKIFPDGSAALVCAIADMGQGQHTVQCQIVAEVLGVPYEKVGLVCRDTDSTPYATLIANSCGTWVQGWATYRAAQEARGQLLGLAGALLGAPPLELDIQGGHIVVAKEPERRVTVAQAFGDLGKYGGRFEIIGHGVHHVPEFSLKDGKPDQVYIPKEKGAQFVSLVVDTETGLVDRVRVVMAQNVGLALNPKIVEGQLLTARHGVDNAVLANDCLVDRATGRLLTSNLIDYRHATIADCEVDPVILEIPGDPTHPFGATACAEGGACPTQAAFANAIYNATGVRLLETPFTPDKILAGLAGLRSTPS